VISAISLRISAPIAFDGGAALAEQDLALAFRARQRSSARCGSELSLRSVQLSVSTVDGKAVPDALPVDFPE